MVIQVIAILHCHIVYVWSYCVLLESLATPVPGQGFGIAPLIHSGNQATKDRGMMRGQFPGAGFSGTSTRLRCSTHQALVVWVRVPPTFLENAGEFLSPSQNSGSHLLGILGKSGNLHHQTASFAGAPIMSQERCHVTQPRAKINVRCSHAGHKGASGGPQKGHKKTAAKDSEGWVPELGRDRARQRQHSHEIADEIGQFPGAGFSGSRTKIQWVTHEASVQHAPGLSGVGGGGVIIRRHRSRVHQSRPENGVM